MVLVENAANSFGSKTAARRLMSAWVACCIALGLMVVSTGEARAEFGFAAFDGSVSGDASGTPFSQAGGHPYSIGTSFDFNSHTEVLFPGLPAPWPDEPVKDVFVDVPPGLVGNPTVVEQCALNDLANIPFNSEVPRCAAESQIGVVTLRTPEVFSPGGILVPAPIPIYNLTPPPGVPARFGFNVARVVVTLDATVRSGSDYGISINAHNIPQGISILGNDITLWGTPADPAHDAERYCAAASTIGCDSTDDPLPFLTLPTRCGDPSVGDETRARTDSWFDPGDFKSASFRTHALPNFPDVGWPGPQQGLTGCGEIPFRASLTAKPGSLASPGPAGYEFDLSIPQEDDPVTGLAPSHLKKAVVTLPEGVRVSPSSAAGLEGCSPDQIKLGSLDEPSCPDGSKIGSLTIDTPVLDTQLTGSVYLATPRTIPSGSLLGVYLVAKGPGLIIKLPGSVGAENANGTGQLVATFDNNPQLPFSNLHLEFNSGPRAPLSNPSRCGTYTTHAVLTSWSGKTVVSDSSFTTSRDGRGTSCPAPHFTPSLSAGTKNPVAGASSPFMLTLTRDDEDDEFKALHSLRMPDGLLARISSIERLCPEQQMAAGTCDANSRVGSVTTAAGPGPNPYSVQGQIYLGGPYKGAPFSLSIVVPVKAGPFDLGTVVVRSAIFVDRHTAKLDVVTDPLPTILEGIPLQVRLVNVTIDRPGFMLNPTSCAKQQIAATVRSVTGRSANVSSRFQVGECAALKLEPKMTLRVGSKGHTKQGATTPFTATLRMPKGGSNLAEVGVTLPRTLNARLPVVTAACTQAQFDAGKCESSRAGFATAVTPLLKDPLKGSAYFVKDPKGGLPNLVVALRGQVDFDLVGDVTIPGGERLATKFRPPDVPITRFTLRLVSGKQGPVGAAEGLCTPQAKRATARLSFEGQNGDLLTRNQRLRIAGCPKGEGRRGK